MRLFVLIYAVAAFLASRWQFSLVAPTLELLREGKPLSYSQEDMLPTFLIPAYGFGVIGLVLTIFAWRIRPSLATVRPASTTGR